MDFAIAARRGYRCEGSVKTFQCRERDCSGSVSSRSEQPARPLLCHRGGVERSCRQNGCASRLVTLPEMRRIGRRAVFFAFGTWSKGVSAGLARHAAGFRTVLLGHTSRAHGGCFKRASRGIGSRW